jgi:hypothetical protein
MELKCWGWRFPSSSCKQDSASRTSWCASTEEVTEVKISSVFCWLAKFLCGVLWLQHRYLELEMCKGRSQSHVNRMLHLCDGIYSSYTRVRVLERRCLCYMYKRSKLFARTLQIEMERASSLDPFDVSPSLSKEYLGFRVISLVWKTDITARRTCQLTLRPALQEAPVQYKIRSEKMILSHDSNSRTWVSCSCTKP